MMRAFGLICLLYLSVFAPELLAQRALAPVQAPAQTELVAGDYHLLSIGISQYTDRSIQLKTAANDARVLAEVLQERWGFEQRNVRVLLDSAATDEAIENELRRLARETRPEDAVLIYFAGHGHLDELTDEGSWIPVNASFNSPRQWISNSRIRALIRSMPARAVLLVSDSCFAGDFFRGERSVPPPIDDAYVREAMRKKARQALTSGGLEPVMDDGGGGHSVFANFLLAELRTTDSPYLLPRDLHRRVAGGVALNAPQQPLIGDLRDTGAELGGEFILFRRGQARDWEAALSQREAQLSELARAEEEARRAQQQRDAEEAAKAAELAELDRRIREMQERLGMPGGGGGGTLQDLVALARQQEAQAAELEQMRQRAEQERAARERRIAELRAQQEQEAKAAFEADYALYLEVYNSRFVTEQIKRQAWAELTSKYAVVGVGAEPDILLWQNGSVELVGPPQIGHSVGAVSLPNNVKLEMVWIAPGEFMMGSPDNESGRDSDEGPQMRVRLSKGYWLGKYEVTQAQWQALMGNNPSRRKGWGLPVENVSWNDAMEFCKRLTEAERLAGLLPEGYQYTLPTEAQWEYACRAGTTTRFNTGDSDNGPWAGRVVLFEHRQHHRVGRWQGAERLGFVRHARQRAGVVCGLVRRQILRWPRDRSAGSQFGLEPGDPGWRLGRQRAGLPVGRPRLLGPVQHVLLPGLPPRPQCSSASGQFGAGRYPGSATR
jgi:formylglycine-generating enzyme required for sulfatase activity